MTKTMMRGGLAAALAVGLCASTALAQATQAGSGFRPDTLSAHVNAMETPNDPPRSVDLPAGGASAPVRLEGGRPLVDVMVNGKGPYHFVVETGAPFTGVTPEVGGALGATGERAHGDSLRIGGAVLRGLDLAVMPIGVPGVDGILGLNAYRDLLLTVDYPRREIRLERGVLPAANGRDLLALKPVYDLWGIDVTAAGHTSVGVIDTQSEGTFTITPGAAAGLPLEGTPVVTGVAMGPGIGRQERRAARLAGDVLIGDVAFQRPILGLVPMPADYPQGFNVGGRILGNFVVTLDQRSRVLRLARESRAPVPAPAPLRRLGFRAPVRDGRVQVTDVSAGGVAEQAGVRVGDEVVSVNGRPAAQMPRDEWNALSASTTPLHFVFRRDGAERTVEITPEVIVP